jgi:signal transduction histidine kinase/DNA-binding NarL/FixJ family response regulator
MIGDLPADASSEEIRRLQRRLDRERAARIEAEAIAEAGTLRLFEHQRRLELTQAIATAANSMEDPLDAFRFAIERICAHSGFTMGHVWTVDEASSPASMKSSGIWSAASPPDTACALQTATLRIGYGEGLPGRVFAAGRAIWTEDLTHEPDCPRTETARLAGMRAGFAFPALIGEEPVAVLEFFQSSTLAPDDALLEMLDRIAAVLGRVVERHRAALRLKRNNELTAQRDAAEQASQAKSAFLANMSHEIRTPLNGILGMAQVLEIGSLSDEQRDQVQTILDSGRNLMALLNDVLDLSKIEAGKMAVVKADTDLTHTLCRLHRLWKPKAEEAGLEFYLSLDADLPQVLNFDAVRVRQCVSNLISNAIKFTKQGRVEVFVTARRSADGQYLVKVRVSDTGIGMDAETMTRLFTPFMQADDSISRKYGGTGLGLSITRKLAELMGGEANVRSEPGRGSEFTFSFLAGEAAPQHRVVSEGASLSEDEARSTLKNQNLRLLLVDDHPINRQVASLLLRPFNMRIVEATNGKEALEALRRETFDVMCLDVHMPVMDGTQTIAAIRASEEPWANIPVIALTADAMTGDKERYMAMGMDGYLSKPIAERDLVTEITRVRSLTPELLADRMAPSQPVPETAEPSAHGGQPRWRSRRRSASAG